MDCTISHKVYTICTVDSNPNKRNKSREEVKRRKNCIARLSRLDHCVGHHATTAKSTVYMPYIIRPYGLQDPSPFEGVQG